MSRDLFTYVDVKTSSRRRTVLRNRPFLDPEGSQSATTVVVLVVTLFEKNAQGFINMQQKVTKLRVHIRDIIPDRSTVLDFYQMAPPSGSVVPFVLVYFYGQLLEGTMYRVSPTFSLGDTSPLSPRFIRPWS